MNRCTTRAAAWAAEEITELVFPLLDADERAQASQVLQRFADLPEVTGFVHGDLAPVNLRRRQRKDQRNHRLGLRLSPAIRPSTRPRSCGYGWPLVKRVRPGLYERSRTHAAMFPLTGAVSALRQGGDPAKFLAWFRRRCAVREHPPAS